MTIAEQAAEPPAAAHKFPAHIYTCTRAQNSRFVHFGRIPGTRCPHTIQIPAPTRPQITRHSPLITGFLIDTSAIRNHLNSFKISMLTSSNRHSPGGTPRCFFPALSSLMEANNDLAIAPPRAVSATQISAEDNKIVGLLALVRLIREGIR
jgi:hypothetical protein